MTRDEAIQRINEVNLGQSRADHHLVNALEALGLLKFDERATYLQCDCSCADHCPQGRIGSRTRCLIPENGAHKYELKFTR